MEFFDKLGKKASEAYKMTADKTGKIAKETKIKLKIGELRTQVNDVYEEIGKKVYEKHVLEGEISIENEIEEYCTKLDVLSDEIDKDSFYDGLKGYLNHYYENRYELRNQPGSVREKSNDMLDKLKHMFGV